MSNNKLGEKNKSFGKENQVVILKMKKRIRFDKNKNK